MSEFKNIFLCLVHEKPDCIVDLVRNLRYFDATSDILLYNGSNDADLLSKFPFHWYGAEICPNPSPKKWGWLHGFAIDGMRHALSNKTFNTITIVDSDQLLLKKGYSEAIENSLKDSDNIGMLVNHPKKQTILNQSPVAAHAIKEKSLWLPLLQTLPGGADSFLYWSFWPSTVFTKKACKKLVELFDTNETLKAILEKTTIWASEEVILPTLVKASGLEIVENPSRYDYVQYKKTYTQHNIQQGMQAPNVFWAHPIPRSTQNELRRFISSNSGHYIPEIGGPDNIYKEIARYTHNIKGWLAPDEAEVLIDVTGNLVQSIENPVVVEIGSYCGKSTCTIGLTALKANKSLQLYAIDPFEGTVGAEDERVKLGEPTYTQFINNIEVTGVKDYVNIIKEKSEDVVWNTPIDFLFIDGLHDYFNVAKDFHLFNKWVKKGSYIALHDYADYYPGVKSFVAEILQKAEYKVAGIKGSMILLEKLVDMTNVIENHIPAIEVQQEPASVEPAVETLENLPMVTCITPTYNRYEELQHSIALFLQQDYKNKELIIIDDSMELSPPVIWDDIPFVKYIKLAEKHTIGEKRNIACQLAQGEIIVHLDDDDWYTPQWISQQVAALMQPDTEITGLDAPFFYSEKLKKAWQYLYPETEKKWVHGATLAYWKKVWEHNPFLKINIGEDNQFVWQSGYKIAPHNFSQGYVGRIHPGNTSPKYTASKRWQITDVNKVERILEAAKCEPHHKGEL